LRQIAAFPVRFCIACNSRSQAPARGLTITVSILAEGLHVVENLIPPNLKKLANYRDCVPGHRSNGRLHLSTISRWCSIGVKLPDGTRLRLRALRAGRRWLTTDEWFGAFVAALTAAHDPAPQVTQSSTSKPGVRHGN
jgi:hypothetical protein